MPDMLAHSVCRTYAAWDAAAGLSPAQQSCRWPPPCPAQVVAPSPFFWEGTRHMCSRVARSYPHGPRVGAAPPPSPECWHWQSSLLLDRRAGTPLQSPASGASQVQSPFGFQHRRLLSFAAVPVLQETVPQLECRVVQTADCGQPSSKPLEPQLPGGFPCRWAVPALSSVPHLRQN